MKSIGNKIRAFGSLMISLAILDYLIKNIGWVINQDIHLFSTAIIGPFDRMPWFIGLGGYLLTILGNKISPRETIED